MSSKDFQLFYFLYRFSVDNAYDPDVNARQLWIDVKRYNKYNYCFVFTDNGAGMGPEKLHKMLRYELCFRTKRHFYGLRPIDLL